MMSHIKNVEDTVINEKSEDILNIDNTHLLGYSTPGKVCEGMQGM